MIFLRVPRRTRRIGDAHAKAWRTTRPACAPQSRRRNQHHARTANENNGAAKAPPSLPQYGAPALTRAVLRRVGRLRLLLVTAAQQRTRSAANFAGQSTTNHAPANLSAGIARAGCGSGRAIRCVRRWRSGRRWRCGRGCRLARCIEECSATGPNLHKVAALTAHPQRPVHTLIDGVGLLIRRQRAHWSRGLDRHRSATLFTARAAAPANEVQFLTGREYNPIARKRILQPFAA